MEGIPAYLNSDFIFSITPSLGKDARIRDCYIQTIYLGQLGVQTSVEDSLLGLPVTTFKNSNITINFVVRNLNHKEPLTEQPISIFHQVYNSQIDSKMRSLNISYIKGVDVSIDFKSLKFDVQGTRIQFMGCRFSRPVLQNLQSSGNEFVNYQVTMSYLDYKFTDLLTFNPISSAPLLVAFDSIKAAIIGGQQFI